MEGGFLVKDLSSGGQKSSLLSKNEFFISKNEGGGGIPMHAPR